MAAAIGMISVTRSEPGAFVAARRPIVATFADQAVIAIENVRLFDEVQARTKDLQEALQQQTATANVLKVISRSAFDLDAVLKTLTDSARSLSGAATAAVFLRDGELFRLRAESGVAPEFLRIHGHPSGSPRQGYPHWTRGDDRGARCISPMCAADPDYNYGVGPQIGDYRALFGAPLIRDGKVEGVFGLMHPKPSAFMPRQMEMVRAFADQAVIAIENVRLFDEVQARTRDLPEALEQQTATAEVLKVISRSAFDLNLATSTILEAAARLCRAPLATLHLRDGEVCRLATQFGLPEAFERAGPREPNPGSLPPAFPPPCTCGRSRAFPGRLERSRLPLQGHSQIGRLSRNRGDPLDAGRRAGGNLQPRPSRSHSLHAEPDQARPDFADQAAIAIENARMFGEVQSRTREVEEALAQQTATAEVLKVISRSAFDLQAVFDTLLASAVELTGAAGGAICMRQGSQFVIKSVASPSPAYRSLLGRTMPIDRSTPPGRVLLSGKIELIADNLTDLELRPVQGLPLPTRSNLAVPLSRDGRVEGAISLVHPEPDAFTQRHIDLVQTFADQAVIAIENVRLFDEVQARTRDIEEALAQQTATAEVLKVISRSAFDLQPVLDTLVESAARLCDTEMAFILRRDGEVFRAGAAVGHSPEYMEYLQSHPISINRGSVTGRVVLDGRVVQILDVRADPEYTLVQTTSLTGQRTALGVPLIRDGEVIGVIVLGRRRVEAFTARQIELVETFADQAVIAISNVGLFNETQESLAQQTATADVLKVISRSVSDVAPVFETILESCQRLLGLELVAV